MDLSPWLSKLIQEKGSDLFISVGVPPMIKAHNQFIKVTEKTLSEADTKKIVLEMMNANQQTEFLKNKELNFAIQNKDARFRVSAFFERSVMGAVLRRIETTIPTLEELNMPKTLEEFALLKRGLVLIVGGTGTGKSTTLAAMIGHRNQKGMGHVVCIEDPIEYIHPHENCIITQREVGIDTESYEIALRNTLRQAPDVILIGEIRSREVMSDAIAFSETGHLCLATLHANNANQALDRIIHFFPADLHLQIWMSLSLNLKAIIAEQLIPSLDGKTRVPAVEILVNTPVIADHIRKGDIDVLKDFIKKGQEMGMQTMDESLYKLYVEKKISYESALKYADSENEVRLMVKLNEKKGSKGSGPNYTILNDDGPFQ